MKSFSGKMGIKGSKFKNRFIVFLLLFISSGRLSGQTTQVTVHLRGVYNSKVSIQSLSGQSIKTIAESPPVSRDGVTMLSVSKDLLPGAFLLRFDYKEKESSTPYPSEKQVIITDQNLELWVHPMYLNNPDSTYFQEEERENYALRSFSTESARRKEKLALIQNFLMGYDQPDTEFYQSGIQEFEKRRRGYNQWVEDQSLIHKDLFVSRSFQFQHISEIRWVGSETERVQSLITSYFEGISLHDPVITKTVEFKDWMNRYVNIYGTSASSIALRDSLFTLAGKRAIEKAREGHPMVYGWMVDYFYYGFESFNIQSGIKMLQPYLSDPRCLTTKRLEIDKRLKGIESIVPGILAPDFKVTRAGKVLGFSKYKTESPYKLILFWSADCHHCKEFVKEFYPWNEANGKNRIEVFAMSVDETELEIDRWKKAKDLLPKWNHHRVGINSPEAGAYFVLSTPTMVLVDSNNNKIIGLPNGLEMIKSMVNSFQTP